MQRSFQTKFSQFEELALLFAVEKTTSKTENI